MDEVSEAFREIGGGVFGYCVDAHVFDGNKLDANQQPKIGTLSILCSQLQERALRGDTALVAQFFKLVIPGTILTRHIFRGLDRPCFAGGDMNADESKLIYVRKPAYDYIWIGKRDGYVKQVAAPPGGVFGVYVTPNLKHREEFSGVDGWIDHWAWLDEDAGLSEASVGWVDRYAEKLWTRT